MFRQDPESRIRSIAETSLADRQTGLRTLAEGELQAVLKRHDAWIASGWNMGQRADLAQVDLHQMDLRGVALMLVDLHGADLRGADLRDADLESTDLRGANLRMADLRGASLQWADLDAADLRRANLKGTNFREANLRSADLRGANLRGANLADVFGVTQPQLDAAYGDPATALPPDLWVSLDTAGEKLSCVLLPLKPKP
jgi:uncharacterized protein YjbI with pentapeptide repeats